jgi:mannitol/fructose-specific phosphotransferase system IIA component (Ntr-type)
MKISELLTETLIKVGLASRGRDEVFDELIDVLMREKRITNRQAAREAILEREKKQSTGIGNGVAVPHGKSSSVPALAAALGISSKGIEYDSLDGEPVFVVLLLVAEENNPGPHVAALARFAALFRIPGFIESLISADSSRKAYNIIMAEEAKLK